MFDFECWGGCGRVLALNIEEAQQFGREVVNMECCHVTAEADDVWRDKADSCALWNRRPGCGLCNSQMGRNNFFIWAAEKRLPGYGRDRDGPRQSADGGDRKATIHAEPAWRKSQLEHMKKMREYEAEEGE